MDTITVDNEETCEYTYRELAEGACYDLMVEVRDKAGNVATAKAEAISTKEWKIKVGDYIKYTPDVATFNLADTEPTTGKTYANLVGISNTSITTNTSTKWRVWSIDEESEEVTIISNDSPFSCNTHGAMRI